jgi:hypothetical protein
MSRPIVRLIAGGATAFLLSIVVFGQARERVAYVSAWDPKTRAPITGLGTDAFAIREDGIRREVLRVTPATSPMAVAILVDNTQAASNHISEIRKALTSFIRAANGLGPIAIIGVAERPTILRDYTSSQVDLEAGVGRVFSTPGAGATLLDAIVETSKGLRKREEDRAAIVVLTTENIEFSTRYYSEVLEALAEGGAMLHLVIMNTRLGMTLDDPSRNRASVFDMGPRASGGTRADVLTSQAFDSKMVELAAILKSQHRVIYGRPEMLIPPKKFEVTSTKDTVEVSGAPARGQAVR